SQCWPIVLSGRDLIGIAATGSGKTLGFGLPMMAHINAQKAAGVVGRTGPYAVVMAPTRELALQINAVDALRKGVEVVVGTPGRVRDLMSSDVLKLRADRMLDLGFEPEIRAICSTVRSDRQTLMFSATWPSAVQKLAATFLSQPVKVTIGSQDLAASHSITQHVEVIEPHARDDRLLQLLSRHHANRSNRIIIFVLYKKEAPRVEGLLQRKGWKCAAIHGDISQDRRTAAVDDFKSGRVPLLIATDVVINYSFPLTTEDYVHRIGRTGRAGKTGLAFTFFCAAADKPRAGELINVLKEAGQKVVINYSFPLTTEDYVHRIGRTGRAGKTGLAFTFFCAAADKPRAGELINVLKEAGQK
ncbi:DEAD box RNA helicase, partial [Haematococcus lacustris]